MPPRTNRWRSILTGLLTAIVVLGLLTAVSLSGSPVTHYLSSNHSIKSPFAQSNPQQQPASQSPQQKPVNVSLTITVPPQWTHHPFKYHLTKTYHPSRTHQPRSFRVYTLAKWGYNVTNISITHGTLNKKQTLATWNGTGPLTITETLHATPTTNLIYPSNGGGTPHLITTRHGLFLNHRFSLPSDTIQDGDGHVVIHTHAGPHTQVTRAGYGQYFGPAHTYSTTTRGNETIRLVVPDDTTRYYMPPERVLLRAYQTEGRLLKVGHRPSTDTVFVTPPPRHRSQQVVQGLTVNSTMFIYSDPTNNLNNSNSIYEAAAYVTWFHEYVHTRQPSPNKYGKKMQWFNEADAQFYAALVTRQEGLVPNSTFIEDLQHRYSNTTAPLANRSAWPYPTYKYYRGPRVLAVLNAQLRRHSHGRVSFMTVQRQLTAEAANGTTITLPLFKQTLDEYLPQHVVKHDIQAYITGAQPTTVPTPIRDYTLPPIPVNTTTPRQHPSNRTRTHLLTRPNAHSDP